MRWTHKCCFQWHLIFFTDCSPKLEYLHWIYSEEKPKIKERQRGWVLHSRQVTVLKWDPRRSGARCVLELTRGKRALVFLESRASISRSTNKQPSSNWEKTKLCCETNNGHWYWNEKDMENMKVLEQVASNPSWASQGLGVPKATRQRDLQSNLLRSLL